MFRRLYLGKYKSQSKYQTVFYELLGNLISALFKFVEILQVWYKVTLPNFVLRLYYCIGLYHNLSVNVCKQSQYNNKPRIYTAPYTYTFWISQGASVFRGRFVEKASHPLRRVKTNLKNTKKVYWQLWNLHQWVKFWFSWNYPIKPL